LPFNSLILSVIGKRALNAVASYSIMAVKALEPILIFICIFSGFPFVPSPACAARFL
jgi:hypothetical protein